MEKDSPEFWRALPDPKKPDNRWRQAGWSVLTKQPPGRDEDVWVRRTYRYQLERLEPPRDVGGDLPDWNQEPPHDVDGDLAGWNPADPYADIAAAHAIHARSDEDRLKGFLIGAILSDAAAKAIAEVARLPLPVVQAFEALFVDVRSKMKAGVAIPAIYYLRGRDGRDRGEVRLCSQIGCGDGFEDLCHYFKTGDMTRRSADRLAASELYDYMVKMTMFMEAMEITPRNAPKLLRVATPSLNAAAARHLAVKPDEHLKSAMDECMADGPGVGPGPVAGAPPPAAGDFAVDDDDDDA